jgi:PHD/YefM family antitoxin component YafN of YafNO toxin-antitoxin module
MSSPPAPPLPDKTDPALPCAGATAPEAGPVHVCHLAKRVLASPLGSVWGCAVGGWFGAEAPRCFRVTAAWLRRSAGWREHTDGVSEEQRRDADRLAAAAEEVEAGRGPVAVARPGHQPVVLVSAEEWQRLQELESAESTAWWRRDASDRAASGEQSGSGEDGPGLDEAAFRRRFAHLFHDAGAA